MSVERRSGVVDLWRSTRTMQIWQQAQIGDYVVREIGRDVSVRVHHAAGELFRFDADRSWWDEQVRVAGDGPIACAAFSVPAPIVRALLAELDAGRPELVARASRQAATSQAAMEREQSERGAGEPLRFTLVR